MTDISANDLPWIKETLADLVTRQELSQSSLSRMLDLIMQGKCSEAQIAAFLVGLRMKGETAADVATAASVLRKHMTSWTPDMVSVLDTCGTGGDRCGTFNISTATALVVAGCGVPVVKHGNRSVSSKSGSADVLAELGVKIDGDVTFVQRCLKETGFCFCFAPVFHPAMRHVADVRRSLGIPTIFNCLGPLSNPGGASFQLLGVGDPALLDLMAHAIAELGSTHGLLVHGHDGLDEVTLSTTTEVRQVANGQVTSLAWNPTDFGLEPRSIDDIKADDAVRSAAIIREVLDGAAGPARDFVLANAAAALLAAGKVAKLREGVEMADESINAGQAKAVLDSLIALR